MYGLIWNETCIGTYLDKEENTVLGVQINESFWKFGGWNAAWNNPWQGQGNNAPFDNEMYLIINLAVGGTNSYFPDGFGKPWRNGEATPVNSFWSAKAKWYPLLGLNQWL